MLLVGICKLSTNLSRLIPFIQLHRMIAFPAECVDFINLYQFVQGTLRPAVVVLVID